MNESKPNCRSCYTIIMKRIMITTLQPIGKLHASEKTKVDIRLSFKQYEFNKELSFPFTVPRNYKTK